MTYDEAIVFLATYGFHTGKPTPDELKTERPTLRQLRDCRCVAVHWNYRDAAEADRAIEAVVNHWDIR